MKPIFVKSGSETPEQIGAPPVPEYELGDLREKCVRLLLLLLHRHFPSFQNAVGRLARRLFQTLSARSSSSRSKRPFSIVSSFQVEKRDPSLMQDYGRDPQYADASIDALRDQKFAVRFSPSLAFFYSSKNSCFFFPLGITTLFNAEDAFALLTARCCRLFLLECSHKFD